MKVDLKNWLYKGKVQWGKGTEKQLLVSFPVEGGHTNSDTDLSACVPTARRITTA